MEFLKSIRGDFPKRFPAELDQQVDSDHMGYLHVPLRAKPHLQLIPSFSLCANNIDLLLSPDQFFSKLLDLYEHATHRMVLAALYVGTGQPERTIIQTISRTYKRRNRNLKLYDPSRMSIDVLVDAVRGTRTEPVTNPDYGKGPSTLCHSLDVLSPVLDLCSGFHTKELSKVNLRMFHSPLLSQLLYRILPSRVNEIMGVFHTKIFLADDTVILTGANLSETYLTNRQDRYLVIRDSPQLTSFLHDFVQHLHKFSYSIELSPAEDVPPCDPYCDRLVPMSSLYFAKSTVARMCRDPETPSPIFRPSEFREALGHGTLVFLEEYKNQRHRVDFKADDDDHGAQQSTLFVAVQIGFSLPRITQEELLLHYLLGPSSCVSLSTPLLCVAGIVNRVRGYVSWCIHRLISVCDRLSRRFSRASIVPNHDLTLKKHVSLQDKMDEDSSTRSSTNDETPRSSTSRLYTNLVPDSPPDFLIDTSPLLRLPALLNVQKLVLASGYLNMQDTLLQLLVSAVPQQYTGKYIDTNDSSLHVYVAAPDANSFHCSSGLSKYIPMAYSFIAAAQLQRLKHLWVLNSQHTQSCGPRISEYSRSGWTFHSKGLWFYTPNTDATKRYFCAPSSTTVPSEQLGASASFDASSTTPSTTLLPSATLIGSSNYGLRASFRDLDLSFLLCVQDSRLQHLLHDEVLQIERYATTLSTSCQLVQRCPFWLQLLLRWTSLKTLF